MMKTGFPKDFLWGGAMASSQAEGAFLQDGRKSAPKNPTAA